ncbi:hypothetical protein BDU57DRAFT_309741 [Ampelomyces quisqualis]|uniref:Uncharacterized protein n=1 Tax=Ampelomyces quisqualis TaxID=50730 RepID=A0A6A5QGV6_AMPQU|nr:hypothetical protein BDU57DRAFT_309741 [Ampelomyces quisqualis]
MAAATSNEQQQEVHISLSPPPSPPSMQRRNKKRHDSFEKLASTPLPSPPSSPSQRQVADEDQDSLLARIILTPVLFTSFILSLSFVNLRDRANRARAHSSTSVLTYLYPSRWLDIEPYQDPYNSSWGRGGAATHVEPDGAIGPKQGKNATHSRKKSWHLNKKIRKVAKLEVSDALEMRGRVIVGMLAMLALGSVVLWFVAKWLFLALTSSISRRAQ